MGIIKSQKGFTLVELVIYIAIVSGFLATTIFFAMRIVEGGQRGRADIEVQQNVRLAMERITREIRSADNLNVEASTFETHPGVLSLASNTPSLDPVLFFVENGILKIQKGTGSAYALTSNDVEVTNFVVRNLSVANRSTIVQIILNIKYATGTESVYYNVSSNARTSVIIREQSD